MSNAARFAACPIAGGGTPAKAWEGTDFPALDLTGCSEMVLLAPHPDDETLGFGATAAMLAQLGVRIRVVAVTDGGAAYPDLSPTERTQLEQQRRDELGCAVDVLGLDAPVRLGLPDGAISDYEPQLTDLLTDLLAPGMWCAATWRGDGHPDHEAAGRAAAVAVERTGAVLLEYPVWMWHWAQPGDPAVPWQRARRSLLTTAAVDRKTRAALCFSSQIDPGDAVLPPFVLTRLLAVGEVVFR